MTGSPAWSALPWLIRDTFRQSLAAGIFWLMLGLSALTVAVCLSVEVVGEAAEDEAPPPRGQLQLAGGIIAIDIHQDRAQAVRTLQLQLAGWVADAGGLLLALVWTAGFLPSFLDAGAVALLLVKPLPRWTLVTGKFVGVLVFVAFQFMVFVGATWLALGCRTGVWDPTYFMCVPVLVIHFAVFFSFSAMLAVATRNTTACVFGSVVFWLLCWAMNFGRHVAVLHTQLQGTTPVFGHTLELGYWVLPKPIDFHIVLLDLLRADNLFSRVIDTGRLAANGAWSPVASVVASVMCAGVLLFIAAYDFITAEY
jgi:ABC-type transport system involved in multi-copper enzyme maturation permease subunit